MQEYKKKLKTTIDKCAVYRATARNKINLRNREDVLFRIKNDPEKKARLEKQECLMCYYAYGRCGGAMMTTVACSFCEKSMYFPSTAVDVLCKDCAKLNGLCIHCGGDIEMKHRRKKYPFEK